MTEIKTVRGRGWLTDLGLRDSWESDNPHNVPVVIVHGLTEAEVHEAAALLAKSREVCEWMRVNHVNEEWLWAAGSGYPGACDVSIDGLYNQPNYCPSCGRKVVVK